MAGRWGLSLPGPELLGFAPSLEPPAVLSPSMCVVDELNELEKAGGI